MKITQESDYAIRIILLMSQLSEANDKIEAPKVAEFTKVPKRFTLKIMRKLAQASVINSYRGNNGGYTLNRKPEDISLKDIIEIIDGPVNINRCLHDKSICTLNASEYCAVNETLADIQRNLLSALGNVSFKYLLEKTNINKGEAVHENV